MGRKREVGSLFLFPQKAGKEKIKIPVYNLVKRKIEVLSPLSLLEGFESLRCVTFSSSIKHLVEVVLNLGIRNVEIVIGLTDDYLSVSSAFNLKEGIIDVFLKMTKLRLYEARGVHSKIYLLENNERKRVIVGSANLSHVAWSGKQKEVFLYSDDVSDYEAFEEIYEEIKKSAVCVVKNDDIEKERKNLKKTYL